MDPGNITDLEWLNSVTVDDAQWIAPSRHDGFGLSALPLDATDPVVLGWWDEVTDSPLIVGGRRAPYVLFWSTQIQDASGNDLYLAHNQVSGGFIPGTTMPFPFKGRDWHVDISLVLMPPTKLLAWLKEAAGSYAALIGTIRGYKPGPGFA